MTHTTETTDSPVRHHPQGSEFVEDDSLPFEQR
jgi:hypothetical protein